MLYQLFVQKYNEIREDMRTRKTFTMLSNMKSLKIRTDKIDIPDLSSINVQHFKPKDKKLLVDLFCNDEHVQQICNEILSSQRHQVQDLSNADMLTYLHTDPQGHNSQIDEHGNIIKRAKSMTNAAFFQAHAGPAAHYQTELLGGNQTGQYAQRNYNLLQGAPSAGNGEAMLRGHYQSTAPATFSHLRPGTTEHSRAFGAFAQNYNSALPLNNESLNQQFAHQH